MWVPQEGFPIGLTIGEYHHDATEKAGNRHGTRRREIATLGVRRDVRRRRRSRASPSSACASHRASARHPAPHESPIQTQNQTLTQTKKRGTPTPADTPLNSIQRNRRQTETPSALVSLEQVTRVHLVGHAGQIVTPAVGHERVAPGLELGQIMRDLAAEELRRVERGLVDHHGHALGLDALHDARIELSRKLSLFDFVVGRYTPTTGFFLPS